MELVILAAGVAIVLIFIGKYRQNKKSQSLMQDAFYIQKNLAHSGYALTNHGTLVAMSILEKGHSRYEAFSWIAVLVSAQNIKKHRDAIKLIQISKRCLSLAKDIKFMYDEGVLAEKYYTNDVEALGALLSIDEYTDAVADHVLSFDPHANKNIIAELIDVDMPDFDD